MSLTLFQRLILYPIGWLYPLLVRLRLWLYRIQVLKSHPCGTPVISVGNLSVGGSGKTPVTECLVRMAALSGLRPVILTRGYGRKHPKTLLRVRWDEMDAPAPRSAASHSTDSEPPAPRSAAPELPVPETMGDEPFLLARRNPEVPLYISSNRVAAAALAEQQDQPGVMVMDDGFQHLRLRRDFNLLLVDAERGFGNGKMFPYGPLRESLREMERADAILITKANLGDGPKLAETIKGTHQFSGPIFLAEYQPHRLIRLDGGGELPPQALTGRNPSLVSAIAQPEGFAALVTQLGATIRREWRFPDHHAYPAETLEELNQAMGSQEESDGLGWLTTEKDAVKLEGRLAHPEKMWVLEMEVVLESAAEAYLQAWMTSIIKNVR